MKEVSPVEAADTPSRSKKKDLLFFANGEETKKQEKGNKTDGWIRCVRLHTWFIELKHPRLDPRLGDIHQSATRERRRNILYGLFTRFVVVIIIISLFSSIFNEKPEKKSVDCIGFRWTILVLSLFSLQQAE
jgi:hypothetical protein